jgi:hypothetical protein
VKEESEYDRRCRNRRRYFTRDAAFIARSNKIASGDNRASRLIVTKCEFCGSHHLLYPESPCSKLRFSTDGEAYEFLVKIRHRRSLDVTNPRREARVYECTITGCGGYHLTGEDVVPALDNIERG